MGNKIDYHARLLHIVLSSQIKLTCLWNYRLIIALLYDLVQSRFIFMSEAVNTAPKTTQHLIYSMRQCRHLIGKRKEEK